MSFDIIDNIKMAVALLLLSPPGWVLMYATYVVVRRKYDDDYRSKDDDRTNWDTTSYVP